MAALDTIRCTEAIQYYQGFIFCKNSKFNHRQYVNIHKITGIIQTHVSVNIIRAKIQNPDIVAETNQINFQIIIYSK